MGSGTVDATCPPSAISPQPSAQMLHRFAKFVAACTVLLILAGSLVTSTDSGLSVPDWPTTLRLEHVHVPAVEVGRRHPLRARPPADREHGRLPHDHPRGLAVAARSRAAGCAGSASPRSAPSSRKGVLGGLTVLFFLPAAISTAHAGLAEIFFCMTVAIALFTSPGWIAGYGASVARRPRRPTVDAAAARVATATTVPHLHADPHRRDDAAHRRGPGDSRTSR